MRYLALDLGRRRTGVAVGDSTTGVVTPLTVLEIDARRERGQALIEAIGELAGEYLGLRATAGRDKQPPIQAGSGRASRGPTSEGKERGRTRLAGEIVVGLPVNMDGTEGQAAREAREFARRLKEALKCPVHLQDERLTTAEAEWSLRGRRLTRRGRRRRVDALAAAAILRDFLARGHASQATS